MSDDFQRVLAVFAHEHVRVILRSRVIHATLDAGQYPDEAVINAVVDALADRVMPCLTDGKPDLTFAGFPLDTIIQQHVSQPVRR